MKKPAFWFPTRSDTNQAVQLQKRAGLKFRISKVEGLYYLCSENKGADQLRVTAKLIGVFVFAYVKCWFSHDAANLALFAILEIQNSVCIFLRHLFTE